MPRSPLTPGHPLTEIVRVRFSPEDLALLDAHIDGADRSTWLRDLARREFRHGETARKNSPSNGATKPTDRHRHKPGEVLAERTVKGVTTTTYRCSEPGCTHQLERTK